MMCQNMCEMTDEEFFAMVARDQAAYDTRQEEFAEQEAQYQRWLGEEEQRQEDEEAAERAYCQAQGLWYDSPLPRRRGRKPEPERTHPPDSALLPPAGARPATSPPHNVGRERFPPIDQWQPEIPAGCFTMAQVSPHPLIREQKRDRVAIRDRVARSGAARRLFEDDDDDEDDEDNQEDDYGEANQTMHIVTMEEVLGKMTAAQARRRYAPSWAFIAWEVDANWFAKCLNFYFENHRWPTPSQVPATVRMVCRDSGVNMQELYVQEAFAPMYVSVARDIDQSWFDWLTDQFFSSGTWPRFKDLPEGIQQACTESGIGPNDLD